MKKLSLLAILIPFFFFSSKAQVGINILNPDSSAVLQLESSSKGLGLPRLNSNQRDSITNPLNGLVIFNTQDSLVEYWNGACWLKAYQKNCSECEFTMSLSKTIDTLDRTIADTSSTSITLAHTNGNEPITLLYLSSLPAGVTIQLTGPTTIDSSATVNILVTVDQCINVGGNYPIILEAFCGDEILFTSYSLYIRPPIQITIPVDQNNYDLAAINGLPSSPPSFVLLTINQGVNLESTSISTPAYTSGSIDANSLVCIVNNGNILGQGGNGGGFAFTGAGITAGGNAGAAGGDAMHLTSKTVLTNLGTIYGGGSGGGSVGVAASTGNLPLGLGSYTVGAGFCGGGGSENGLGGVVTGTALGLFKNGGNATCCVNSTPGAGPTANYSVNIPIVSILAIGIDANVQGGNGGGYGQSGTAGSLTSVTLQACVDIPIIGNTCFNVASFGPYNGPGSPGPGVAIKRNGNSLYGILDGNYSTTQIKGVVGP